MKKIFLISLLVAFLLQGLSGLWIWASFQINREYIADNLCINRFESIPVCKGSCYLENQLSENEQQQQDMPDLKLKEITVFYDDRQVQVDAPYQILLLNISFPLIDDAALYEGTFSSVFKPPVFWG